MGIEIKAVNKYFKRDGKEFQVLDDINLEVQDGEFISIVGASGCGKSTLLRAIAGLDPEHEGSICINGEEITKPGRERGMVFQEHRLFPWMNVEDNIAYVLEGKNKEEKAKIVREHIKLVGLSGFEKALPKQLSGGMAQRAGIARALANDPNVLLLDEPFGALDAFTKISLQNEIRRIHKTEKKTMILVTHDIDEAVFLADRIVVLSQRPGKIQNIIPVELSEPRDRNSEEFLKIRKKVYREFFEYKEVEPDYII
jgi:sulfonate transport system ATP-binding protein